MLLIQEEDDAVLGAALGFYPHATLWVSLSIRKVNSCVDILTGSLIVRNIV